MSRNSLRPLSLVLALLTCFIISSCPAVASAKDLLERVKERGEIVIGTEARFAPFEFVEEGKIVGYSADLLALVMQGLPGVKVNRLDVPWQGILPGLEAKKFDYVVTSVTATRERFDRYRLSVPIADATVALLVGKNSEIKKPEDVVGRVVGSQAGSAQLKALQALNDKLVKERGKGVKEIKEYVDFDEAFADLDAGRIEAVAQSFPNLSDAVKKRPDAFRIITPPFGVKKYFSWAARKDDDSASLAAFFDDQIRKLIKDGSMTNLQVKWFGFEMPVPDTLPEPVE